MRDVQFVYDADSQMKWSVFLKPGTRISTEVGYVDLKWLRALWKVSICRQTVQRSNCKQLRGVQKFPSLFEEWEMVPHFIIILTCRTLLTEFPVFLYSLVPVVFLLYLFTRFTCNRVHRRLILFPMLAHGSCLFVFGWLFTLQYLFTNNFHLGKCHLCLWTMLSLSPCEGTGSNLIEPLLWSQGCLRWSRVSPISHAA